MVVSIFNDVIGPVMRGPSSSHCAAALRIGRIARDIMNGEFDDVLVEFDRNGSLPGTHESQGSDMGLCGGLLGWDAADERLPNSPQALRNSGVRIRFEIVDTGDAHPNTYRLTLSRPGKEHTLIAISTGGGMMEVIAIDGVKLSISGDYFETLIQVRDSGRNWVTRLHPAGAIVIHSLPDGALIQVKSSAFIEKPLLSDRDSNTLDVIQLSPILPVLSRPDMHVPFSNGEQLVRYDNGRNESLWKYAVQYEMARGRLSESEVIAKMVAIVRILRNSIAQGIAGTHYDDRVLGYQSGGFQKKMNAGGLLNAGALNRIVLYVTALMEVKSSMGVIVAAPTAGACAALPGAVIAMAEELNFDEEAMARAMLASGLIGVFIATRWTFAAEVGGCQAEGGSAASMAAAALVTMAGGTLSQALGAASMALQSMLGLICDPVANRVEAPCLGKNVMAASNAVSCANMALSDFDSVIPFDEVIEAAMRVSAQMPRELRCTALGGLSTTPTSLSIEQKLLARKTGCGTTCGCLN